MKPICVKIFLFFLVLIAASVHADIIVDNLNQPTQGYFGPIGDDSTTNDFLIGQEFTLPSATAPYQINQITLLLSATSGGGNITISVWNAGPDNNPTNEIV
ncbi:MAG: choice-of-anchor R domain-containing protein, partial [Limisphaerales bacterium]